MTERRRIFILNNPLAPRLCPELAEEIGLAESILLLQIEFWISISDHYIDESWWTYQSLRDIQRTFIFWSLETINRTIKSLAKKGLIQIGNYNKAKYDRTRWFALSEEAINRLQSISLLSMVSLNETPLSNNKTPLSQKETESSQIVTTIPETTTETSSEITPEELDLLSLILKLSHWESSEEDVSWLIEFEKEYPSFCLEDARACRDFHDGRKGKLNKGIWKHRLRNWMKKKAEFAGDGPKEELISGQSIEKAIRIARGELEASSANRSLMQSELKRRGIDYER